MFEQDPGNFSELLCARPITLQFPGHAKPRDGLRPRCYETADRHVMCFPAETLPEASVTAYTS